MKTKPFLFTILLVAVFFWSQVIECKPSREIRKSLSMNRDGRVLIDTYKGSITVDSWDRAEVEILAIIEADGWDSYAEEKVRDTEIEIDGSPMSVRIHTDYSKIREHSSFFFGLFDWDRGSNPYVHYRIKMPRTATLKIKDYKSETKISDLYSTISLDTYKGRVDIRGLDGSIDLETYKGNMHIAFVNLSRYSSIETYKGKITIELPEGTGFDLDADFGRRVNFYSDFDIQRSHRRRRHGDQYFRESINGGGPTVQIVSKKGTIRLFEVVEKSE